MKKTRILAAILAPCLVLSATACTPAAVFDEARASWALFAAEKDEIFAFFDADAASAQPDATRPSVTAMPAVRDTEAKPMLDTLPHTELLDSPYRSASWAVYDAGTADGALSAADTASRYGYTRVPAMADRSADAAAAHLRAHGLTVTVEERLNPTPAGEVFAIRYAGMPGEDGAYYMNPAVPVVLYVSAAKAASLSAERAQNVVYLTFDDGPTARDTLRLLDILDRYGVKAAFFTTGEAIEKYPEAARAIAERGHALGCHSVTHDYETIYASVAALDAEVTAWEEIVSSAGITLEEKLFRFPGGSVGKYLRGNKADEMQAMLESRGYAVFDWNVVTNDSILYMATGDESVYAYIQATFAETLDLCLRENEGKTDAPILILMHETVPETVDLMPWLLEYLITEGYLFGDLTAFGGSWTFADR